MAWIRATYTFVSTFSYRIPGFSSSYAMVAPIPSPSTVKLALVATAIQKNGDVEAGIKLFEKIKASRVTIEIPKEIAVFKSFIKRLKPKRLSKGFESTFGIREYAIYGGPLSVFIEKTDDAGDVVKFLRAIRYFGTSDSVCTNLECDFCEPSWEKVPRPYSQKEKIGGVVFLLTDFTNNATFESINPYSKVPLKSSEHIVKQPYVFPLKVAEKKRNYTIYRLKPFELNKRS
jgi:CRISPR-associated Cas5-like protein